MTKSQFFVVLLLFLLQLSLNVTCSEIIMLRVCSYRVFSFPRGAFDFVKNPTYMHRYMVLLHKQNQGSIIRDLEIIILNSASHSTGL